MAVVLIIMAMIIKIYALCYCCSVVEAVCNMLFSIITGIIASVIVIFFQNKNRAERIRHLNKQKQDALSLPCEVFYTEFLAAIQDLLCAVDSKELDNKKQIDDWVRILYDNEHDAEHRKQQKYLMQFIRDISVEAVRVLRFYDTAYVEGPITAEEQISIRELVQACESVRKKMVIGGSCVDAVIDIFKCIKELNFDALKNEPFYREESFLITYCEEERLHKAGVVLSKT